MKKITKKKHMITVKQIRRRPLNTYYTYIELLFALLIQNTHSIEKPKKREEKNPTKI